MPALSGYPESHLVVSRRGNLWLTPNPSVKSAGSRGLRHSHQSKHRPAGFVSANRVCHSGGRRQFTAVAVRSVFVSLCGIGRRDVGGFFVWQERIARRRVSSSPAARQIASGLQAQRHRLHCRVSANLLTGGAMGSPAVEQIASPVTDICLPSEKLKAD